MLLICTLFKVSSQTSDTNYALPSIATEVSNLVINMPAYLLTLAESGKILSKNPFTCDGHSSDNFEGSVGFTLQHHFDKETLNQLRDAYSTVGGFTGIFKRGMEEEYNNIETANAGFLKKGPLLYDQLEGATVAHHTITQPCQIGEQIGDGNGSSTKTKIMYHVMLLTENDYALITVELYSETPDKAKQFALEIINKIKSLDCSKVN